MMTAWRRSTAQNPMTGLTGIFTQQDGGIDTSGRIYGGTATGAEDTAITVVETNEKRETDGSYGTDTNS